MSDTLRIIYAGTPEFAVPALCALCDSGHEVVAVYTQPDRRAGRGRKLSPSPVKAVAQERDIPVEQPLTLRDSAVQDVVRSYLADVMVVAAYGLILPAQVLQTPTHGCVNIHASLLPRWRGAAPIQRAIEAGDTHTGVTIMQMDRGLDTGDMLRVVACPIDKNTTAADLHDTLATLGANALMETLPLLAAGQVEPVSQDDSLATYAEKLDKKEARMDWRDSAEVLHRRVCAFNPWPVAQTTLGEEVLRIWKSEPLEDCARHGPMGSVVSIRDGGLEVQTGAGCLRLLKVQPPGRKPMAVADFLNSRQIDIGTQLG